MSKVSILMPACNVEKYIEECMDSVLAQTLQDIEIICIDDGSKDNTGKILDEYANKDKRVKIVHKENSGYGDSMNVALGMATGEYIGIIETDDFIEPDMFEVMYNTAKEKKVDVVKTDYYNYYSTKEPRNAQRHNLDIVEAYETIFTPKDNLKVFLVDPSVWSGLYRTEMIRENDIKFLPTPGASYQDTSFAFKIWASAETVYLINKAFLHYRRDNDSSSVNSPRKVFCVCDEYEEIGRFLVEKNRTHFNDIKNGMQFNSYRWNYNRLGVEYRYAFLIKIVETFKDLYNEGKLNKGYFRDGHYEDMVQMIEDPYAYFLKTSRKKMGGKTSVSELLEENKKLKKQLKKIKQSKSFRIGKALTAAPRKLFKSK